MHEFNTCPNCESTESGKLILKCSLCCVTFCNRENCGTSERACPHCRMSMYVHEEGRIRSAEMEAPFEDAFPADLRDAERKPARILQRQK